MFYYKIFKLFFLSSLLSVSLFSYPQISQDIKDKKIYPMGEKIYKAKCNNIDVTGFKTYEALSLAIKDSLCGTLSKKYEESLSLYIWDVKLGDSEVHEKLLVSKKDKCQVCGMYMHHYPTWVSRIKYPNGEAYNFDGMKCMFKFYFNNKKGITDILVQDYYTLHTLNAREAYFVIGSDVYGPMGHELIPFVDKKSATTFSLEHKGDKVYTFDEITENMVRSLGR